MSIYLLRSIVLHMTFWLKNVEEEVDEYADIWWADYVAQFLNKSQPKLMCQ
jgi:hypothetical protein